MIQHKPRDSWPIKARVFKKIHFHDTERDYTGKEDNRVFSHEPFKVTKKTRKTKEVIFNFKQRCILTPMSTLKELILSLVGREVRVKTALYGDPVDSGWADWFEEMVITVSGFVNHRRTHWDNLPRTMHDSTGNGPFIGFRDEFSVVKLQMQDKKNLLCWLKSPLVAPYQITNYETRDQFQTRVLKPLREK